MVDFSSEKYSSSTGHTGTPGTSREMYSKNAYDGTRPRSPSSSTFLDAQTIIQPFYRPQIIIVLSAGQQVKVVDQ